jgi:cellobiose phosphorylase
MPLCVGIYDRADATINALFKSDLYTKDGLLTAQGSTTFWDRSTLYAFRGGYAAGYADFITEQLSYYSNRRLLGDHVPYPIEAWPEGSQRHLSAESGLYCRIITEGMFGIRPTGMRSFELKPEIPSSWEFASLKSVRAFGSDFDIDVKRLAGDKLRVDVVEKGGKKQSFTIKQGKTLNVKL